MPPLFTKEERYKVAPLRQGLWRHSLHRSYARQGRPSKIGDDALGPYVMPSVFSMSSSGTPLVSSITVITHIS